MSKYPVPETFAVTKTEDEWKAELSAEDYRVIRNKVDTLRVDTTTAVVVTERYRQQHESAVL